MANWGNSGLEPQRVVLASPENRAMMLLLHLLTARTLNYHEDVPNPSVTMPSGRSVEFEWRDIDLLIERGFIELTETDAPVTPAGRTAVKRWQRRYGVEIGQ